MPTEPLFDLALIDTSNVIAGRQEIAKVNPQRHEFQQLDAICYVDDDAMTFAGYRDVREDEFWVRGHIPGRPIFPGVLMIEVAAQLVSYYVMAKMADKGFVGFAGVDGVKFRGQVRPGQRIIMVGKMIEVKHRRCVGATQAYVDGKQVYEGVITGMCM